MKRLLILIPFLFLDNTLFGQVLIWSQGFNTADGISSTTCMQITVNTLANTTCIPSNWLTGRLQTSGSNIGRRWAATTQWPRTGDASLDFEPGTTEYGGLMSGGATLTAGIQYSLEFFYRIPATTGGGSWRVEVGLTTTNSQQALPALTEIVNSGNTNTTWNRACYSFTVPSTGTYYVYLRTRNTNAAATQRILIDDMSLYTSPSCLSVLAVTLNNFTATCEGNFTRLIWETESEQSSDYFTLERSRDGQNWAEVTTVDGAGTTNNVSTYAVEDNTYSSETYYRLKQTDYDGKSEYFPPIIVNCNSDENGMIVFPNPSTGNFAVEINSSEELQGAAVVVYDLSGKQLARQEINGTMKGTNVVYFNDGKLASGTYLVVVESDAKNSFKPVKLIIQ